MQITRFKIIGQYKCLKDFEISFDTSYEGGYSNTVLIGENGSGKSSLIEALTLVIMSYDSLAIERQIKFSYILEYIYAGLQILLSYSYSDSYYKVQIKENNQIIVNRVSKTTLGMRRLLEKRYNIRLFPYSVITYYSGTDERLDELNGQRERAYVRRIHDYLESRLYFQEANAEKVEFPYKKYWYYTKSLSAPILFALLLSNEAEARDIKRKLNIRDIESFQIEIDTKSTLRYTGEEITKIPSENSDYLFEVMDAFDEHITRRLERSRCIVTDDRILIRVTDFSEWFMNSYTILDFFDKLSLVFRVNYRLRVISRNSIIDTSEFSEGQRQLVNALGLLTICKEQDCLVLMDEPDVYLNPRWKYEYRSYIKDAIDGAINAQILISTHDPLMINGLSKDYIRRLELVRGHTKVYYPTEETEGMGIDGLLQSQYYGLRTSYDEATDKKYQRRMELFSKMISEELTKEEERELADLTVELNGLPAMNTSVDFLYDDFMREYRKSPYYLKEYLSVEELKRRNVYIQELIEKLFTNKG